MPDSAPDDLTPKKRGSGRPRKSVGGPNDPRPRPVPAVDLATKYLHGQLDRSPPGQWTDNRLLQSQHMDGVTYVAIRAMMTAIRSSTVQITRERKPVDFAGERGNRIVKALPSAGSVGDSKKHVPFDDRSHPLVRLINRPNNTETINDLLAQTVQQLLLTGSGMLWMNVDRLSLPQQLFVLPTALCQAQPPSPQYPYGYWRVTQYYPAGAYGMLPTPGYGGGVPIDDRNVMQIKEEHPLWRWDALSPLTAGSVQLTILEAIDQARFSAMESGLTTDAFITSMGQSQEQMNAWLEMLRQNNVGKRNHRKIMALGGELSEKGDVKVQFPNASARDMDYSGGWDQMSAFALSLFGVPKVVANFMDAGSYAQLYAALKQFHTRTLVPLADRLGRFLTMHLCRDCYGEEFTIQIDVPAIDDADMNEKKRATNLQNGLYTYNEARAQENLPPVKGGDDLIASVFVQVQTAKAMAAAQPQPAPGAAPGGQPAPAGGDAAGAAPPVDASQGQPAAAAAAPDQERGAGDNPDPLSSLTGAPSSEQLPDDQDTGDGSTDESETQDAVTNAALAALGIGGQGDGGDGAGDGDGAGEGDDSPIPQNRIAKAYLGNGHAHTNGNGHAKALPAPTKPGVRKHQEGEKWQAAGGQWETIKNGRPVKTTAPGAAQPAPAREKLPTDAAADPSRSPVEPSAPANTAANYDTAAAKLLNGRPSIRTSAQGPGGVTTHEIKDGKTLKAFLDAGGNFDNDAIFRPVWADAGKSIPSTPAAKPLLSKVDQWAAGQADKHSAAVARHFGIDRKRAHALLVSAIKQVAAHANKTGGKPGAFTLTHKGSGKTASFTPNGAAVKKPASRPPQPQRVPQNPTPAPGGKTGAPSIPAPKNAAGKGSLPPRPSSKKATAPEAAPAPGANRNAVQRGIDHALKLLGTPAEKRLAKRRIASRVGKAEDWNDADDVEGIEKAAMSAYTDSTGGSLVAPATLTPVVPLQRPKPAIAKKRKKTLAVAQVCKAVLDELDAEAATETVTDIHSLTDLPDISSLVASLIPLPVASE